MFKKLVSYSELERSQWWVARAIMWQINAAATKITTSRNRHVKVKPFILKNEQF